MITFFTYIFFSRANDIWVFSLIRLDSVTPFLKRVVTFSDYWYLIVLVGSQNVLIKNFVRMSMRLPKSWTFHDKLGIIRLSTTDPQFA